MVLIKKIDLFFGGHALFPRTVNTFPISTMSDASSNVSTISTQTIRPMHEKRYAAAVATIDNGSFIVIGGHDGRDKLLSSCEVYDGRNNTWTRLPTDMPEGRFGCQAATIGRNVYVVGGSTMVVYSLDSKKWTSKTPMKKARDGCAVAASNGRLFVFGGTGRDFEVLNT